MGINIIKLYDLISSIGIDESEKVLKQFEGITLEAGTHDVETFIRKKSIQFENASLSTTYLVFDEETNILLGFFSLANKPLTMSEKNFLKLSKNQQKKLNNSGQRIGTKYQINSFLIGQIGKNFSDDVHKSKSSITGKELLTLAYDKVVEASMIINAKYVWLECENVDYLNKFYKKFGFSEVQDYTSENGLKVMILKITKTN
ncbi:hypothetical protein [Pseudolactococcus piscium]|uniref:Putative phage protein n=1 Tax=Pseudolactococcus piscium MKFS47 TaxID=297352 RepID=A0A0D6DWU9_9LACT|nr:hypothetical protein [Lactococcus piscium]CEN27981.1 Putative phage protein [Lactococcus piscium MKFS47]